MFNKDQFVNSFSSRIAALEQAENIVRSELRELGNGVLHMLHTHGNTSYVNDLLSAKMTSVNKRAMRVFLQYFSGFHVDKDTNLLTKKNNRVYGARKDEALTRLADPSFDFWSWSEAKLKVEREEPKFDGEKLTKYLASQLERAALTHGDDAAKAVAQAVLAVPNFMAVLGELVAAE